MPKFGKAEIRNLTKVIESGRFCDYRGGFMDRFRAEFASALEAKHAITAGSAMLLMQAIPGAIGAGPGDEIICDPVVQFHGIACLHNNVVPVWADVRQDDFLMDPKSVEERVTPRTKAIWVTHLWGFPAELDELRRIADRHGIYLLEDCAHALLAKYKGRYLGNWGHLGTFSFNMGKQLPTGEGGMAITNDDRLAAELNKRIIFGESPEVLSSNYRMTEFQAAVGVAQLKKVPGYLKTYREGKKVLDEAIADCPWLDARKELPEGVVSPCVAGQIGTFMLQVILGQEPVEAGGSLRVVPFKKVANYWVPVQNTFPRRENHVSLDLPKGVEARLEVKERGWAIEALILKGRLAPGDRATVVLGDQSSGSPGLRLGTLAGRAEFRVPVRSDADAKEQEAAIAFFDILPAEPDRLLVRARKQLSRNTVLIRASAVDRFGNTVTDKPAELQMEPVAGLEPVGTLRFPSSGNAIGQTEVQILGGTFAGSIEVKAPELGLKTMSDPVSAEQQVFLGRSALPHPAGAGARDARVPLRIRLERRGPRFRLPRRALLRLRRVPLDTRGVAEVAHETGRPRSVHPGRLVVSAGVGEEVLSARALRAFPRL